MSTAVTFSAPGCVLVGGNRDLRSLGITDCPVTAMTVTRCDGRDITGVRYPPYLPVCPDGHSRIRHARMGILRRSIIQRGPSSRRNRDSEVIGNGDRTTEGCAGDATRLRLGADWLDVPEPVAALLRQHLRNRSYMTTATNPASPWLFPGKLVGEHRSYRRLVRVLHQLGIPARTSRRAAWRELARQAPPAVLADALGV